MIDEVFVAPVAPTLRVYTVEIRRRFEVVAADEIGASEVAERHEREVDSDIEVTDMTGRRPCELEYPQEVPYAPEGVEDPATAAVWLRRWSDHEEAVREHARLLAAQGDLFDGARPPC